MVVTVSLVKMNFMYLGVDKPIQIAVSGYEASEIEASVVKGSLLGENGEYIVRPHLRVVKRCRLVRMVK